MTGLSPLVALLGPQLHVEGGYIPRAVALRGGGGAARRRLYGERSSASSSYLLLHPGERSRRHLIASAERWLHHTGSPLLLTLGGQGAAPEVGQALML